MLYLLWRDGVAVGCQIHRQGSDSMMYLSKDALENGPIGLAEVVGLVPLEAFLERAVPLGVLLVEIVLFDGLLSEGMAVFVVVFLDEPVFAVLLLFEPAIGEVTLWTGLASLTVLMTLRVMMWKPALVGIAPGFELPGVGLNRVSLSLGSDWYCYSRPNYLAAQHRLEGEAVPAGLVVASVVLATLRWLGRGWYYPHLLYSRWKWELLLLEGLSLGWK